MKGHLFLFYNKLTGIMTRNVSSCPTDNGPSSKAERNPLKLPISTIYPVIDVGDVLPYAPRNLSVAASFFILILHRRMFILVIRLNMTEVSFLAP